MRKTPEHIIVTLTAKAEEITFRRKWDIHLDDGYNSEADIASRAFTEAHDLLRDWFDDYGALVIPQSFNLTWRRAFNVYR